MVGSLCELTTPFINARWFMDKAGMKSSMLYLVNGLIMLVSWFLLRVLLFGYMGWRIVVMWDQIMTLTGVQKSAVIFAYTVGYGLQLFWFKKILRGALKAVGLIGGGGSNSAKKKA